MNKMNKKVLLLVSLVVISLVILSGCGKETKELVLWNPFTGADGDYFQEIVEGYNKTNPDYKVKNVIVPEMYTKIYTVMNSKKDTDIPDITVMHAERVELFESQKIISPMDDVIKGQANLTKDNYIAQAWDSGEVDGKRYTIPLDVHSLVLYYNKDLLDKYGPNVLDDNVVTFDELKEVNKKAKKDNIVTYPFGMNSWLPSVLTVQLGGQIEKDGLPTIDTPEMKQAMESIKEIVDMGAAQDEGVEPSQLFQSGEAIFMQDGTWYSGGLADIEGLNWGVTNSLAYSPDKITNWTSSHQFGLLKKERSDEKKAEIGKFLEYVRENSAKWADSGQNAASVEVFEATDYQERPQSFLMSSDKEKESMVIFDFKNNGITMEALGKYTEDMSFGRLDISEGLKEAQKLADDQIKEGK